MSPTPGLLSVATDHEAKALVAVGKNGAIVRSVDGDATWSAVAKSGTTSDLEQVIAEPKGALVAVGRDGAIVRSVDGGATWAVASSGTTSWLQHVIADPSGALVAEGAGDVVRSVDGGATWSAVPRNAMTSALLGVVAEPKGALVAVGWRGEIIRSVDGGATWSAVTSTRTMGHLIQVITEPKGALVAVGRDGAIARSVDGGATWSAVATRPTMRYLRNVIAEPKGALVAVGGHGAIVRSVDGGATWSAVTDSRTTSDLRQVIAEPKGALVAVGESGAIVRSVDGGVTWLAVPSSATTRDLLQVITEVKGVLVAVGRDGAVVRSIDDGATWSAVPSNVATRNLWHMIAEPKGALVAVGSYGAIVRSADGGVTWSALASSGTESDLFAVTSGPNGALVAVGEGGAIVRSVDGGLTWSAVATSGTTSNLVHVVAEPKGALVAVGSSGAIVRSVDGGAIWSAVANSGTESDLQDVISEANGALVAVGESGAIVRSVDAGATWSSVAGSGTTSWLEHVIADPNGALVAVGHDGAIVRSVDGGATWSAVATSGTTSNLVHVVAEPRGVLVAVGDGGAIIRGENVHQAPTIGRITHSYSATGDPILRLKLDDPERLCPLAKCVTMEGRSQADETNDVAPRVLPSTAWSIGMGGDPEVKIDPSSLSAKRPDPVYVRLHVAVPGYSRMYYRAGEKFFKVPNHPEPIYGQTWFQTITAGTLVAAVLLSVLLARPLWLLGLAARPEIFEAAPKAGIPGLGDLMAWLVRSLLLPVLSRHPRVLNAWVEAHAATLQAAYALAARGASDRASSYVALPVDGPDGELVVPSPERLAAFLRAPRSFIQVVGPGGAGKTQLAIEIGRWVFAGSMTQHPASAVFIDEEFSDLLSVIQDKLRVALMDETPPVEIVKALLSRGRLWVIVDRVSERQPQTRDAVTNVYRSIAPKIMICTARYPIKIDGLAPSVLRPRPLDSTTLLSFLGEQLRATKALGLFPSLGDQGLLVQRLAKQITIGKEELPVTPLLVRVFVARAVELASTKGMKALEDLPSSVPEAYFTYVERLDATKRDLEAADSDAPELVRRAAALLAFIELGDDFRPKPVSVIAVEQALRADPRLAQTKADYVKRMENNGLLIRRVSGSEAFIEYILDPLAECLGAFEHACRCGSDAEQWAALIKGVAERKENSKGFLLALRMNHAAYADVFGFPPMAFPGDLNPKTS